MFRSVMTAVGIAALSATAIAAQTAPAPAAKPKATVDKSTTKATRPRSAWVSGEISRYDASSKTLTVKQGASEQTFVLADNARIMEGKKTMTANDLSSNTGHNAKVRYRASGTTRTVDRVELAVAKTTASAKPATSKTPKKG